DRLDGAYRCGRFEASSRRAIRCRVQRCRSIGCGSTTAETAPAWYRPWTAKPSSRKSNAASARRHNQLRKAAAASQGGASVFPYGTNTALAGASHNALAPREALLVQSRRRFSAQALGGCLVRSYIYIEPSREGIEASSRIERSRPRLATRTERPTCTDSRSRIQRFVAAGLEPHATFRSGPISRRG